MTSRPWQASYGRTAKDIDPDAYRSVVALMDEAMKATRTGPRCAAPARS